MILCKNQNKIAARNHAQAIVRLGKLVHLERIFGQESFFFDFSTEVLFTYLVTFLQENFVRNVNSAYLLEGSMSDLRLTSLSVIQKHILGRQNNLSEIDGKINRFSRFS